MVQATKENLEFAKETFHTPTISYKIENLDANAIQNAEILKS